MPIPRRDWTGARQVLQGAKITTSLHKETASVYAYITAYAFASILPKIHDKNLNHAVETMSTSNCAAEKISKARNIETGLLIEIDCNLSGRSFPKPPIDNIEVPQHKVINANQSSYRNWTEFLYNLLEKLSSESKTMNKWENCQDHPITNGNLNSSNKEE